MKMTWTLGEKDLTVDFEDGTPAQAFPVSNEVRNAENHKRSLENPQDVVFTTPNDGSKSEPYMPIGFPAGKWWITGVHPRTSDYLAPFFISTNACRMVPAWSLSEHGDYDKPTGKTVQDAGYGLHFAKGTSTTLGCLRFINRPDLERVAKACQAEDRAGRQVSFVVSKAGT